jgi:hypothetical protein
LLHKRKKKNKIIVRKMVSLLETVNIDCKTCLHELEPFMPDAQTLLTVLQTTVFGIPAPRAACLAGACPKLALKTLPKKTSCTRDGSTFALLRAADHPRSSRYNSWIKQIQQIISSGVCRGDTGLTFNSYGTKLSSREGRQGTKETTHRGACNPNNTDIC